MTPEEQVDAYLKGRLRVLPSISRLPSRPYSYSIRTDGTIADGATSLRFVSTDADSHFLVDMLQAKSSLQTALQDGWTIQISDTTSGQPWSNQAVDLRDACGISGSPKKLIHPQLLRPNTTVQVQVTNNTGSAASLDILLWGTKVYGISRQDEAVMKKRLWFQYVVPITRTAGQRTTTNLQILNESDFLVYKLLSTSLIESIASNAGVRMNVRNTSTDHSLSSTLVNAALLFGFYAVPNAITGGSYLFGTGGVDLRKPLVYPRNSVVEFDVENEDVSNPQTFNLTLEGVRVFTPQPILRPAGV